MRSMLEMIKFRALFFIPVLLLLSLLKVFVYWALHLAFCLGWHGGNITKGSCTCHGAALGTRHKTKQQAD